MKRRREGTELKSNIKVKIPTKRALVMFALKSLGGEGTIDDIEKLMKSCHYGYGKFDRGSLSNTLSKLSNDKKLQVVYRISMGEQRGKRPKGQGREESRNKKEKSPSKKALVMYALKSLGGEGTIDDVDQLMKSCHKGYGNFDRKSLLNTLKKLSYYKKLQVVRMEKNKGL